MPEVFFKEKMNKINQLARNLTRKMLTQAKTLGLLVAVLAMFGSGTAKAQDVNLLANTNKLFAFNLILPSAQPQPPVPQVDMNKVNIEHDPEAIKAYMQQIAPEYGVDWKLVYAIGAYESGYYKSNLARNSNNFFGRKATSTTWRSWNTAEEGIRDQFVYLKTRYIDRGLDTPAKMNRVYCEGNTWQYKVQYIMNTL